MAAKARYACLALLFLLGIQLATCKSVDETFKDDHYNTRTLSLSKRDVDDEDTTTLSSEENAESDNDEETTPIVVTSTPKPLKKRKPAMKKTTTTTTTPSYDDELITGSPEDGEEIQEGEEDEVAPTVKPLLTNKSKPKNQKKAKPATVVPSILDRINPEEDEPSATGSHLPKQPASNLLPPMPNNYYPQNYNGFMSPTQNQPFPSWGYNPVYASPPTAYDYPRPAGPAFSDSKPGKGSSNVAVGNGFASASASASGSGGTVSTSTSPGNGYHHSSNSFGTQSGSIPTGGSLPNSGSFVSIRGSFPATDGESVGIEVNGPVSSGSPVYEPNYAGTGPSYAGSGSYGANPYTNTAPNFGGYVNPADLQAFFQQYFAALQAQQQAFQQQLQAQIDAQRQAIWEQSNQVDSNFGSYGSPHPNGPQTAYAGASLGPNGGFQTGHISPAAPGIFSRFGEDVPPPSGKQFGVFSSSSSSSATGPDGKQVSHKSATVGINDNGKVTYKTVHDP